MKSGSRGLEGFPTISQDQTSKTMTELQTATSHLSFCVRLNAKHCGFCSFDSCVNPVRTSEGIEWIHQIQTFETVTDSVKFVQKIRIVAPINDPKTYYGCSNLILDKTYEKYLDQIQPVLDEINRATIIITKFSNDFQ